MMLCLTGIIFIFGQSNPLIQGFSLKYCEQFVFIYLFLFYFFVDLHHSTLIYKGRSGKQYRAKRTCNPKPEI